MDSIQIAIDCVNELGKSFNLNEKPEHTLTFSQPPANSAFVYDPVFVERKKKIDEPKAGGDIDGKRLVDFQFQLNGPYSTQNGTNDFGITEIASRISTSNGNIDISDIRALQLQLKYRKDLQKLPSQNQGKFDEIQLDFATSRNIFLRAVQGDTSMTYPERMIAFNGSQRKETFKERMGRTSRLVITPSFDRYLSVVGSTGTYLCSDAKNKTTDLWGIEESTTMHIILVRPFQKDAYVREFVPRGFVVATLPSDEEGVGSARYWACMLATYLKKTHFIMLDDSYYHDLNDIVRVKMVGDKNNLDYKKCTLLHGVKYLEGVFNGTSYKDQIGVISLRRHNARVKIQDIVKIDYAQAFQLIHVSVTNKKGVFFRRHISYGEDLMFSQTCINNGLMSIQCNMVQFYDCTTVSKAVKDTGCHSPYRTTPLFSFQSNNADVEFDPTVRTLCFPFVERIPPSTSEDEDEDEDKGHVDITEPIPPSPSINDDNESGDVEENSVDIIEKGVCTISLGDNPK